ncbi:MAG: glycosyltransferase, partial [Acidobacteriota bacterium]
ASSLPPTLATMPRTVAADDVTNVRGDEFPFLVRRDHGRDSRGGQLDALLAQSFQQVMRDLQGAAQELRILAFAHNCGQSAALDAGFKAARGNVVVTMDGDLQNDPRDIPRLMEALEKADVVVGWRGHRRDSLVKRWTSRAGNHIRNLLTHEKIRDTGCSLKAFRRNVLEEIKLFKGMHRFLPTLARMGGFSVVEIKVNHRPREHGKTKYGIFDRLWVTVPDLFAVRWMQRRSLRYEVREEHS